MFPKFILRPLSLPVRLVILVAGTTLPLIGFAGALTYQHYLEAQQNAVSRVEGFTRGVRLVLDREMNGIVAGLTVLASSPSLETGDFEAFRTVAVAFLARFPGHPLIVIGDRAGQIVFNSGVPAGVKLPMRTERPDRDLVFRTGKPAFSSLFYGSLTNRQIVTVTVPVFRGSKVIYDLSFNPPQEIFQKIIDQQKPSTDWTIAIFDQYGVNFARVPNPAGTVGKSAAPSLLRVMFSRPEGHARTVSLEGVPLITAFSRSQLTGWIAAAGIAESTLTAPALRNVVLTASIGAVMLVIGLAFAVRMATRIARGETLHALLINELNHRVKNTLATVQSLAAQTFRGSGDAEAKAKFNARLASLGRTHDILSEQKWDGADIREVVDATLAPFESANPERISLHGPELRLSSRSVVMLSMVIHELATNAAKYGALSTPKGRVAVDWREANGANGRRVELHWREVDGPAVEKPTRNGFGSTLIEQGFAAQLYGSANLSFEPKGVACTLEFPLLSAEQVSR